MTSAVVNEQATPTHDKCPGFITELVVRCGRGDEAALGQLFDLFHSLVRAALMRTGRPEPLEEQVIEAFVRVWQHAPAFRPGAQEPVEWVMRQVCALDGLSASVAGAGSR